MLVSGLILGVIGLGFYAWLLFTFAVYALPVFAGLTMGAIAYHWGAGAVGAIVLALLAGSATLALGRIAVANAQSPPLRAAITVLYAAPATIAGYHTTLGLAHLVIPSEGWRVAFAIVGAGLVGAAAWARLSRFIPPTAGQGGGKSPGQLLSRGVCSGSARGEPGAASAGGWSIGSRRGPSSLHAFRGPA